MEIAFRDYRGADRAVVLLPGIGGNLEAEHETAMALSDRWRIVTVDLRGMGQSGEPETITAADLVVDVETVVSALELRPAAVVGHSLGGVVAGWYGAAHPDVPVVSVDGFDAGVASVGTLQDRAELDRFMAWARRSLRAITAAPAEGDDDWRGEQIRSINEALDAMGFPTSNRRAMVARQFVHLPDGRWRRHPSAKLVDAAERDAFGSNPAANIVRMFRSCTGPVLILRCTKSAWPDVLDAELDELTATHPNIIVTRHPLTHTGPVTDGVDLTVAEISGFLSRNLPAFRRPSAVPRNRGAVSVGTGVT